MVTDWHQRIILLTAGLRHTDLVTGFTPTVGEEQKDNHDYAASSTASTKTSPYRTQPVTLPDSPLVCQAH